MNDLDHAEREMFAEYGATLKRRRHELGITQAELARRLNCSVSTVSRVERGRAHPNPPFKPVIEAALS